MPVLVPLGSVAVSCSVATDNCSAALVPPPGEGFCACTDRVALEPAGALIWALMAVADWYVAGTATPLTSTTVPDTNPPPVSVIEAVAPANAWLGLADLREGAGLSIASG